ncbi:hypothetical protein TNCT_683601 [Trichonephila clavata]|uniref:Uncharacterized protein n=1 Tax=Trichonephila clavata TaxID=2740835 RepID=A0A8X6KX03_TRICU|nr:hypothetical protein TNCT_683601 [Trichonephila clavata]
MQESKKKQLGVIRVLAAEGVGGREMHRRMNAVYGEYSLCSSSVVEWHKTSYEGLCYWKTMLDLDTLIGNDYESKFFSLGQPHNHCE